MLPLLPGGGHPAHPSRPPHGHRPLHAPLRVKVPRPVLAHGAGGNRAAPRFRSRGRPQRRRQHEGAL